MFPALIGCVLAAALASLAAFFVLRPDAVPTPAPLRLEEVLFESTDVSASEVSDRSKIVVSPVTVPAVASDSNSARDATDSDPSEPR